MTTGALSEEQILSMSDEDILAMGEPGAVAEEPAVVPPVNEPEPQPEPTPEPEPQPEPAEEPTPGKPAIDTTPGSKAPEAGEPEKAVTPPEAEAAKPTPAEIDYKGQYEKIMAPFKANGKEIKLDNPEDAIRLMQMGANYTKKMQALQPGLKVLKMLENQGLLDEGKLNTLIDIHKGNPAAIQQLIKNSGIDPLEIDTSKDPGYVPGNHSVSEQELQFSSVLDEVTASQEGQDIVVAIDKQWDDASKQALYKEPEILRHLLNQKQIGVFDQIVSEVERQKMLGNLVNTPFIQAYNTVGAQLRQAGTLKGMQAPAAVVPPAPTTTVVETRAAAPVAPAPVNSDKARAASPTKSAPQKVKQDLNPLSMSDDEFLKLMNISV